MNETASKTEAGEFSTSLTKCLTSNNIIDYINVEKQLTIEQSVKNGIPLVKLTELVGHKVMLTGITIAVQYIQDCFLSREKLSDNGIIQIASILIDKYPAETLEDIILCFRKIKEGEYGKLYSLNSTVIMECMALYLDEKYQYIENAKHNEKFDKNGLTVRSGVCSSKPNREYARNSESPEAIREDLAAAIEKLKEKYIVIETKPENNEATI